MSGRSNSFFLYNLFFILINELSLMISLLSLVISLLSFWFIKLLSSFLLLSFTKALVSSVDWGDCFLLIFFMLGLFIADIALIGKCDSSFWVILEY